jgi:uridine kinase
MDSAPITAPPFVIAVAGYSGAGKTTLVNNVAARFAPDSAMLFFDHYAGVSNYPEDLAAWLRDGADPDRWETPRFAEDLGRLRAGEAVELPEGRGRVEPAPYIVVEEPFGRLRAETARYIDFVACIDVPQDIALARRIRRDMGAYLKERSKEELEGILASYLGWYLETGSRFYAHVNARVKESADLIVDGRLPADEMADKVITAVMVRQAPRIA